MNRSRPAPDAMWSSTTTKPSSAAATVILKGNQARLEVEVPGFRPERTTVELRESPEGRELRISDRTGSAGDYSTKTLSVWLSAQVGEPLDDTSSMENGILTMVFHRIPARGHKTTPIRVVQ